MVISPASALARLLQRIGRIRQAKAGDRHESSPRQNRQGLGRLVARQGAAPYSQKVGGPIEARAETRLLFLLRF